MNKIKQFAFFLIISIAATFTFNCSSDDGDDNNSSGGDGGTLVVTDIPATYNGKYAGFEAAEDIEYANEVWGLKSVDLATKKLTFVQISNGKVSLPLWLYVYSPESVSRYSGNDTFNERVSFRIYNVESYNNEKPIAQFKFPSITFSNGNATISFNSAEQEY